MIPAAHTRKICGGFAPPGPRHVGNSVGAAAGGGQPFRRDLTCVIPAIVDEGLRIAVWCGLNRKELERLGLSDPGENPWTKDRE